MLSLPPPRCQLAAKAAVRDLIAQEELTKGDANADEDAQPEITRKHFEEAFNLARRSVNVAELNKSSPRAEA